MPRTLRAAVLVLTASLLLAGCAASSDVTESPAASAPAITVDPATGVTITGTGYSFSAPEGWTEPDQAIVEAQAAGTDTIAIDTADADGFADNVNVSLSPAGEVSAEVIETQGVTELENAGATDVAALDRVNVAGAESGHLTAGFAASGVTYTIDQYYPTHDGQTYIVTFSFSTDVSQADREAVAESVLATWAWA